MFTVRHSKAAMVHKKWKLQITLKFIHHHHLNYCSVHQRNQIVSPEDEKT